MDATFFSPTSVFSDSQKISQQYHGVKNTSDEPQKNGNRSFWTVCPYCYCLHEYDGIYEECCLRCQNCRRPFHGVAVPPPPVGVVVEGKEQYYCGVGYFPLRYDFEGCLGGKKGESGGGDSCFDEKKGNNEAFKEVVENVVVISDDSDDDLGNQETGEDKNGENSGLGVEGEMVKNGVDRVHGNVRVGEAESVMQGSVRIEVKKEGMKVMGKVKWVARNTMKVMGKGKKYIKLESRGESGNRRGA
ncbi:hypothetical protein P3X46_018526 [Hevea brasiliensis]|uniref:Uncharacterized protein n=1 Tax=Hevea brasiliensis TaxID=3981 RepID=A0ABQ9LQZ3_HEVBR|nr:uncharacterized protein LOC110634472 [Hevea brasiliensis]KAJ9170417.1 hypothetical protein P3X46_018526 [Hevea brasiliensis]